MNKTKTQNNKAWFFVLPVFLMVALSSIIPLMTVVNYSVQDIMGPNQRIFVGWEWFREVLRDPELHGALGRQLFFSLSILLLEVPLGVLISLLLPHRGAGVSVCLILLAMPLLIPHNVVGTIWQIFARADIGLAGSFIHSLGLSYNYAASPVDAWVTLLVMDIWHWTPLVILLCYSALRSVPEAFYQAARIDSASRFAIFRFIELPRIKKVLVMAILLRFIDSFMIYTEPFVLTGGGPGNATTFLSQFLTRLAVGQFDLGKAAAFSLIYFLVILLFSYVFYNWVMKKEN